MAEDFSIRFDTASTRRFLDRLGRQTPYILALALTSTAKDAQARIKARMPAIFDQPTRFTLNATQVNAARKNRLVASVGYKYLAGRYLAPEVDGGPRRDKGTERLLRARGFLPDRVQVVPAEGAEEDQYGTMNRGQLIKALSSVRAFGEEGAFANRRADGKSRGKRRNETYFLANAHTPRAAPLMAGIYRRFPKTNATPKGQIIPVLAFVRAPTYRPRFDRTGIVEDTARERLLENLEAAVEKALATAR